MLIELSPHLRNKNLHTKAFINTRFMQWNCKFLCSISKNLHWTKISTRAQLAALATNIRRVLAFAKGGIAVTEHVYTKSLGKSTASGMDFPIPPSSW